MDTYIKKSDAINALIKNPSKIAVFTEKALIAIESLPAEDVVQRAEVERLQQILNSYALQYGTVRDKQRVIDEAKREGASEIFEEIEQHTKDVGFSSFAERFEFADFIAELKKKYTEDVK